MLTILTRIGQSVRCHLTRNTWFLLLAVVFVMNGFGANTLTVKVDSAQYVVHKEIYGVLMERLGRNWSGGVFVGTASSIPNTNGMRNDLIQGFADCGVGLIEFPGGCASGSYSWQSNTAPANDVGTDRFMQFCTLTGAEPGIALPPAASSAPSNYNWIKYINNNASHPEWKVKYVKIGNEVWGGCGSSENMATYETNFNANYDSLKKPVNRDTLFIMASNIQTISSTPTTTDTEIVHLGSKMNALEFHDYVYHPNPNGIPCVTFTGAQYMTIVGQANKTQIAPRDSIINAHLNLLDPAGHVKIDEDEWGDWLATFPGVTDGWMQQVTLMDALSAAEQLHVFMRYAQRMQVACLAQAVNVIHALFLTNQNNQAQMVKTPTYYIFKMFKPHHSAGAKWAPNALVTGTFGGLPSLSAGTTVDTLGHVNVSLSNIDTVKADTVQINLSTGKTITYTAASAQIITGPNPRTYNAFGATTDSISIQPLASANYSMSNGTTATVIVPKTSIVMMQFSPPTGVGQTQETRPVSKKTFSITESHGMVRVTASVPQGKAVTISLYNVEGKLIDRASKQFPTANSSFVLGTNLKSNGIYMVKVETANGSFTKNVMIAR